MYEDRKNALNEFLNIWGSLDKLEKMNIHEYTGVNDYNNFTYWVETLTIACGNIKGGWATKFGIYGKSSSKRLSSSQYEDDGEYAWYRSLGKTRTVAFHEVRRRVIAIINSVKNGKLQEIEDIGTLWPVFKWKIAFLYHNHNSGIKLLPVYSKHLLAKYLNESPYKKTMLELYTIAINKYKVNTLEKAFELADKICGKPENNSGLHLQIHENYTQTSRKGSKKHRKATRIPEKEIQARHEEISVALEKHLNSINEYKKVYREATPIDMVSKTNSIKTYYEIKTYKTAKYCIREALGQLLEYCYYGKDNKYPFANELIIVAEANPSELDIRYMEKIRKEFAINIYYQRFDMKKKMLVDKI